MSDLLYCPYCKAENAFTHVFEYQDEPRTYYGAKTICGSCGARVESNNGDVVRYSSPKAAIEAAEKHWNTRAEDTCSLTIQVDGLARGWWCCSECNGVAPAPDKFNYCPYCGRKVVEE